VTHVPGDAFPPPSGNGGGPDAEIPSSRPRWLRVVVVVVLVSLGLAWAAGLWYSLARRGPEPLDDATGAALVAQCLRTGSALRALPAVDVDDAAADRAERVVAENEIFGELVDAGRGLAPAAEGREALEEWFADWQALLAARARFADALETDQPRRLVVPGDERGRPITVRMDDYAVFHDLEECSPVVLRAEIVDGDRAYPSQSTS
jgi:hypothetical protein